MSYTVFLSISTFNKWILWSNGVHVGHIGCLSRAVLAAKTPVCLCLISQKGLQIHQLRLSCILAPLHVALAYLVELTLTDSKPQGPLASLPGPAVTLQHNKEGVFLSLCLPFMSVCFWISHSVDAAQTTSFYDSPTHTITLARGKCVFLVRFLPRNCFLWMGSR